MKLYGTKRENLLIDIGFSSLCSLISEFRGRLTVWDGDDNRD